ncbi:hypothetical protein ACE41H_24595 [Paenibacillus enshidis]|uniref:Sporulation histidine kinase inhibitor Sda n=1 Tax=Paenibacillus enshidis TaxID=1458439 RepID=A0ABV5B0E9_9BACL
MARISINTTLEQELYNQIKFLALRLSVERNEKVNANDLIEEGMRYVLEKYEGSKS